jgi:hypothetical protein
MGGMRTLGRASDTVLRRGGNLLESLHIVCDFVIVPLISDEDVHVKPRLRRTID